MVQRLQYLRLTDAQRPGQLRAAERLAGGEKQRLTGGA